MQLARSLQDCSIGIMLQDRSIKTVLEEGEQTGKVTLLCSSPQQAIIPVLIMAEERYTVGSIIVLNDLPIYTNRVRLTINKTDNFLQCIVEERDGNLLLTRQQIEYIPQKIKKDRSTAFYTVVISLSVLGGFFALTLTWILLFNREFIVQSLQKLLTLIFP